MPTEIFKLVRFSAGHRLTGLPDGHPCSRMHGHNFEVEIHLRGEPDPRTGVILLFEEIKKAWEPLEAQLDHQVLNDIQGLENPTCEHLARWVWDQLKPSLPPLCRIVVRETPSCGATYYE